MDIILQSNEIPSDLIEFFEPIDFEKRGDVLRISTQSYSGAHFATFPEALVAPCIRAGTSQRGCCPKCGKAWVRVVEKGQKFSVDGYRRKQPISNDPSTRLVKHFEKWRRRNPMESSMAYEQTTTGWHPACDCYGKPERGPVRCKKCKGTGQERLYPQAKRKDGSPYDNNSRTSAMYRSGGAFAALIAQGGDGKVDTGEPCPACKGTGEIEGDIWPDDVDDWPTKPCTILDPFCGSGTTLLVARKLGRSAIGLDLSYDYLHDQARARLELDKVSEWEDGPEPVEANWDDLPLFGPERTDLDVQAED